MRILLLILALLLPAPVLAQPAPAATLTLQELEFLIQQAADTPARWSFQTLQLLLAKRQQAATAHSSPEPPTPEPKAP